MQPQIHRQHSEAEAATGLVSPPCAPVRAPFGVAPPGELPLEADAWRESYWAWLEERNRTEALLAPSESAMGRLIARRAQEVIRAFSTSFFVVTRFLPPAKRAQVEVIYASVRYPDEVVDSFPLTPDGRRERLERWREAYELALAIPSLRERLVRGVPCFLAAFASVVEAAGIPHEHYRSFLDAMERDIAPSPFESLEELVEGYIYGSATVVGYFLAHVYGASPSSSMEEALASARHLAIALQLTNFLRDVSEDHRRGRLYLPLDLLREAGLGGAGALDPDAFDPGAFDLDAFDPSDPAQQPALARAVRRLSEVAESEYAAAEASLSAFSPDCRPAIEACIRVYRQLNRRVGRNPETLLERESVPMRDKLRVLPPSKYWRIPLAFMGLQDPLEGLRP